MTILDTYALVALALDEPAASTVEQLLREEECGVASASLAELCDRLVRRGGLDADAVTGHLEGLLDTPIAVRDLDRERAVRAGLVRARHYRPKSSELSLADCVLLASLEPGDRVATADPPLARSARTLGFDVVPLPDTRGRLP